MLSGFGDITSVGPDYVLALSNEINQGSTQGLDPFGILSFLSPPNPPMPPAPKPPTSMTSSGNVYDPNAPNQVITSQGLDWQKQLQSFFSSIPSSSAGNAVGSAFSVGNVVSNVASSLSALPSWVWLVSLGVVIYLIVPKGK
jgi:hypothetical protein